MTFSKISMTVISTVSLMVFFIFIQASESAEKIIFTENFENKVFIPAWQIVSGDWHIADVQELRIAPAEKGYRYVLRSGEPGIIRLLVDIPDTLKARQVTVKLSYYTYARGSGATIQTEFHKKAWKDGMKGKIWKTNLPVKGRWIEFRKTLSIPKDANQLHVTFETGATGKMNKAVCFDSIILSVI